MTSWADKFESIGDNCEFGFMQKQKGIDHGSILKWCRIMSHKDVIKFLNLPKEEFYLKNNLTPVYDDMLIDNSTNIQYHSILYSKEEDGSRNFIDADADLDEKYNHEYVKKSYMYDKFFRELRLGEKIYVFKENGINDLQIAMEIIFNLKKFNSNNILFYVTDADKNKSSAVEKINDNLYRGFIKSFAPYYPVTDARLEYWEEICQMALDMINQRKHG